jgi:hypothetical protein
MALGARRREASAGSAQCRLAQDKGVRDIWLDAAWRSRFEEALRRAGFALEDED